MDDTPDWVPSSKWMASRNHDELLTVSEAAEYLNVSISTMRRWLRRQSIEHIQVGRTIRLRRSVL